MPIDVEIWRRQAQQLAARAMGRQAWQARTQVGEMRADGCEADLIALPQAFMTPLQDEDGNFTFMVDLDAVDSGAFR